MVTTINKNPQGKGRNEGPLGVDETLGSWEPVARPWTTGQREQQLHGSARKSQAPGKQTILVRWPPAGPHMSQPMLKYGLSGIPQASAPRLGSWANATWLQWRQCLCCRPGAWPWWSAASGFYSCTMLIKTMNASRRVLGPLGPSVCAASHILRGIQQTLKHSVSQRPLLI